MPLAGGSQECHAAHVRDSLSPSPGLCRPALTAKMLSQWKRKDRAFFPRFQSQEDALPIDSISKSGQYMLFNCLVAGTFWTIFLRMSCAHKLSDGSLQTLFSSKSLWKTFSITNFLRYWMFSKVVVHFW